MPWRKAKSGDVSVSYTWEILYDGCVEDLKVAEERGDDPARLKSLRECVEQSALTWKFDGLPTKFNGWKQTYA